MRDWYVYQVLSAGEARHLDRRHEQARALAASRDRAKPRWRHGSFVRLLARLRGWPGKEGVPEAAVRSAGLIAPAAIIASGTAVAAGGIVDAPSIVDEVALLSGTVAVASGIMIAGKVAELTASACRLPSGAMGLIAIVRESDDDWMAVCVEP